jgi:hypothetical protein
MKRSNRRSNLPVLCAFLLVVGLLSAPGCAAVALTAGGVAGSAGVEHTLSGITYKTFASSLAEVRHAALTTLGRMDIEVTNDHETEDGREIQAVAKDRTIDIELEAITQKTTKHTWPWLAEMGCGMARVPGRRNMPRWSGRPREGGLGIETRSSLGLGALAKGETDRQGAPVQLLRFRRHAGQYGSLERFR